MATLQFFNPATLLASPEAAVPQPADTNNSFGIALGQALKSVQENVKKKRSLDALKAETTALADYTQDKSPQLAEFLRNKASNYDFNGTDIDAERSNLLKGVIDLSKLEQDDRKIAKDSNVVKLENNWKTALASSDRRYTALVNAKNDWERQEDINEQKHNQIGAQKSATGQDWPAYIRKPFPQEDELRSEKERNHSLNNASTEEIQNMSFTKEQKGSGSINIGGRTSNTFNNGVNIPSDDGDIPVSGRKAEAGDDSLFPKNEYEKEKANGLEGREIFNPTTEAPETSIPFDAPPVNLGTASIEPGIKAPPPPPAPPTDGLPDVVGKGPAIGSEPPTLNVGDTFDGVKIPGSEAPKAEVVPDITRTEPGAAPTKSLFDEAAENVRRINEDTKATVVEQVEDDFRRVNQNKKTLIDPEASMELIKKRKDAVIEYIKGLKGFKPEDVERMAINKYNQFLRFADSFRDRSVAQQAAKEANDNAELVTFYVKGDVKKDPIILRKVNNGGNIVFYDNESGVKITDQRMNELVQLEGKETPEQVIKRMVPQTKTVLDTTPTTN